MEPFFQMEFFWKFTGYKSILKRFFLKGKRLKMIFDIGCLTKSLCLLPEALVLSSCVLLVLLVYWLQFMAKHLQPCLAQNKNKKLNSWQSGCRVIASLCPCFCERFRSNNRVVPTSVARVLASQCCFSSLCTLKVAEVAPESLILPAHSKGSL